MTDPGREEESALVEYLSVLRRQWVLIVLVVVVTGATTTVLALSQSPRYSATAEVALNTDVTGTTQPTTLNPDRLLQTEALLARDAHIAARAVARVHVRGMSARDLLASSSVAPVQNADILTFRVTSSSPGLAARLATAYATAYRSYRIALEVSTLQRQLAALERKLAAQAPGSALHRVLAQRALDLKAAIAVPESSALVVRPAGRGAQTAPRVMRNSVLGVVLGVFIGVALAFVRDRLDPRIRDADSIGEQLQLPLLGRLPTSADGRLPATWEGTDDVRPEIFRTIASSFIVACREAHARVVMATSAIPDEGKSSTIAGLAVALAEQGRSVVLVDFDLRNPTLASLLGVAADRGISDVVRGPRSVTATLLPINPNGAGIGETRRGRLRLLAAGAPPREPGQLLASPELTRVFDEVRAMADVILVDTPPLLRVGDALELASYVDALLVVTRIGLLDAAMAQEFERLLATCAVTKLGYVATGVSLRHLGRPPYGYGGTG